MNIYIGLQLLMFYSISSSTFNFLFVKEYLVTVASGMLEIYFVQLGLIPL
jgi:hypothetical protein